MALVLTLRGGTQLLDRFDEIEVVGRVDDIAIAELVACVRRRGWQAAKLSGSDAFRTVAARALIAAGVEVVNPLLTAAEIEALPAPSGSGTPRNATPFSAGS